MEGEQLVKSLEKAKNGLEVSCMYCFVGKAYIDGLSHDIAARGRRKTLGINGRKDFANSCRVFVLCVLMMESECVWALGEGSIFQLLRGLQN